MISPEVMPDRHIILQRPQSLGISLGIIQISPLKKIKKDIPVRVISLDSIHGFTRTRFYPGTEPLGHQRVQLGNLGRVKNRLLQQFPIIPQLGSQSQISLCQIMIGRTFRHVSRLSRIIRQSIRRILQILNGEPIRFLPGHPGEIIPGFLIEFRHLGNSPEQLTQSEVSKSPEEISLCPYLRPVILAIPVQGLYFCPLQSLVGITH